jgi:drug/metabolite transporter (DMT)-like permease
MAQSITATPPAAPVLGKVAQGMLLGGAATLIWGAYLALARAGVSAGLTGGDIAAIRFTVAGAVLLPWLLRHAPTTLGGVGWRRGTVLTLLAGPPFILLGVGGYAFAPLAHGAVVQPAVVALASILLAWRVLHETPPASRLASIGVIVAGLAVIAGPGLLGGSAGAMLGDAMFALAGLGWAGFTVLARRWRIAPLPATAAISVLGAASFLPFWLLGDGPARLAGMPHGTLAVQVLVQGALSGVVAVLAYSQAARLLGPGRASLFPAMVPAVAIVLGVHLAGEAPDARQALGLAVVSVGLLLGAGLSPARLFRHRA